MSQTHTLTHVISVQLVPTVSYCSQGDHFTQGIPLSPALPVGGP